MTEPRVIATPDQRPSADLTPELLDSAAVVYAIQPDGHVQLYVTEGLANKAAAALLRRAAWVLDPEGDPAQE